MESSAIRRWRSAVTILTVMCTVALCAARQPPLTTSSSSVPWSAKTHVVITNNLGPGSKLSLHCKSGDDDLGPHVIDNGRDYDIAFRPNFFDTTLFFCSFSWAEGSMGAVDIYTAKRDVGRCAFLCRWTVTRDGVNGLNFDGVTDIVYKWD